MALRQTVRDVLRGYDDHDVLTFASALALRTLFAVIPLTLFGLGLLGGLGLDEQWTREWAGQVKDAVSPDVFRVIDDTVRRVLGERQTFWMTAGLVIAVWEMSSGMRAIMDVLDRIYGASRDRTTWERLRVSLLLGLGVGALLLAAVASAVLGDDLLDAAGLGSPLLTWLRWPVALLLLTAVVSLLIGYAPVDRRSVHWISHGSALAVIAWFGTSLVLGWYLTDLAHYGSIFGALATVWIVLTYLYFASAAFLTGAELDALIEADSRR
jgi:membrane protein